MTTSTTLSGLQSAKSREDTLRSLKDLKNSVIGNTWKKVEVAEDETLLTFLLSLLDNETDHGDDVIRREILIETAVVIGALANVGDLTIRPLIIASAPARFLSLIRSVSATHINAPSDKILPALLRGLRNILVATADLVWGHMWGVGAERKVVSTGLVGSESIQTDSPKGKGVAGKSTRWKGEANRALGLIFEQTDLDTLLFLLHSDTDMQTLLPLYQLFARLVALPSHREALARWRPRAAMTTTSAAPGPSALRLSGDVTFYSDTTATSRAPYILQHLLSLFSPDSASGGRRQPKVIEAALDLLAALVKGQPTAAAYVRSWSPGVESDRDFGRAIDHEWEDETVRSEEKKAMPEFIGILVDMLAFGPTSVRIAAASCLTNIIKSDKGSRTYERIRSTVMNLQLLDVITKLLRSEGLEDQIKLCFVLAALVSDDAHLQKSAAEYGCPAQLVAMIITVDKDEAKGIIGSDLGARTREAVLISLAALAFQHEPTRSFLSETTPPFLPHLRKALSHPSYGVRAAACQLARALSRTVAILRTSLIDSGIGEEVYNLLKREVEAHGVKDELGGGTSQDLGERAWTVEVAATATLCNLIADFSPLKSKMLATGGIEMICSLTHSEHEPLALNALWAIKNLTFHALDSMKSQVMVVLGWTHLRSLLSSRTVNSLRVQALEITQNLLADAPSLDLLRLVENLGEGEFLDLLENAVKPNAEEEIRVPALYILSNLALGNEKARSLLTTRVQILESLSEAINAKSDLIKVPALRCLRHLLESNARTHKPRQGVLDVLQPYQLKPRLRDLSEGSPSLDVCQAAVGLLEVLERGREGGNATAGLR